MQSFGEQLLSARKAAGMTQDDLAKVLHFSRTAISHWENGWTIPDENTIRRLAKR